MRAKDNVCCRNIPIRENENSLVPFCLQTHLKRCAEPWVGLVLESGFVFSVSGVWGRRRRSLHEGSCCKNPGNLRSVLPSRVTAASVY